MSGELDRIFNILLSQGYAEELFSELGKHRQDGKENMKTTCPNCGGDDFSFSLVEPLYQCWNCGESGSWLAYLQKYRGMEQQEAIQYLAERAGVDVDISKEVKKAYQEKKTRAEILREAQDLFKDDLWTSEGKEVLDYLQERGYREKEIESMGLGAYLDRSRLVDHLKDEGFSLEQIGEAGLFTGGEDFGFGITHQVAILWRDRASRPSGLVCRATDEVMEKKNIGSKRKYLNSSGMDANQSFIGFEKARGEEEVTVVEGILDSLYLNNFDYPAVAIGGNNLSNEQLRALEDSGIKRINIALDRDEAGGAGTEKIVKQLQGTDLKSYVLSFPEGKDPDDILREGGAEAFEEVLHTAQRGVKWLAQYIASSHDLETDKGLDKAVSEGMDTWEMVQRDQRGRYKEALVEALPVSEDQLDKRVEKQRQELTQEKALNTVKNVERKLTKLRQEGNISALQRTLEDGLEGLKDARGITAPEPYTVDDFLTDINKSESGLETGFSQLDRYVNISRGALTFVAGRPGHGKTTLKLNLLLNMIENYPDQNFYFFSYEEARDRLSLKLIMNLAGEELNSTTNFNAYLNYFKEKRGHDNNQRIEGAMSQLYEYMESGRLYLVAEAMKADKLSSTITHLVNKDDNVGAVFIDYIQKVEPPSSQDQRYREIAKVTERLRETAQALDIAIIAGAQLNRNTTGRPKMDDLRESGDIEQDANLILGVLDGKKDSEAPEVETEDMYINIVKNREGPTKESLIPHKWERQNFKIESIRGG